MGVNERMFWVAMYGTDAAFASMVSEPEGKHEKRNVGQFFKKYAGYEIKRVNGDEMRRLLTNYVRSREPATPTPAAGDGEQGNPQAQSGGD